MFFTSAQTGDPQPAQPASALVGTPAEIFQLTLNSTGTVTAVNEAEVDELAADHLRSLVPAGQEIAGDTVDTARSAGTVVAETVIYEVEATALSYRDLDAAALTVAVRGKSITEARSILAPYGMVEISIWPDFVGRLPDQTSRISLVVVTPSPRP
jgi:hypothetical protein